MFSIADMAVAGAVALLLFGPDQLPKVARRAGQLVRDVQNTSQSFIREMERAAEEPHRADPMPYRAEPSVLPAAPAYQPAPEPAHHPGFDHAGDAVFEAPAGRAPAAETSHPGEPAP